MAPKANQRRFRVDVTEEDIAKAKRNESTRCVVAQAIARTVPDATRIEVDTQTIRFTRAETGERFNYLTPPEAAGYVIAFDAGDELAPFRFWIDRPLQVARRVRTQAGRKADNARWEAKKKAAKAPLVPGSEGTSDDVAPVVETMSDEEKAALGKAAYQAAAEDVQNEVLQKTMAGPRSRPRVYKTGKRVYGSRILRVNRYLRETEA